MDNFEIIIALVSILILSFVVKDQSYQIKELQEAVYQLQCTQMGHGGCQSKLLG